MAITLFAVGALMAPLHQLLVGLGRSRATRNTSRPSRPFPSAPARAAVTRAVSTGHGQSRPIRPLRVVRVSEPCRSPAGAGRMVISGRMADVCAEIDRLAELESGTRSR